MLRYAFIFILGVALGGIYAADAAEKSADSVLKPLQEYIGRLHGGRVPELCEQTQEYFRDIDDHLSRINQSIDSFRELVITATTVNLSLISLQESETVKRLAAYAALVAVPTMIAGVYGMNFEHMPELKWTWGYPLSVALMFAIDAFLFVRFRKIGWV